MIEELIDLAKNQNIALEIVTNKVESVNVETLNENLKNFNIENNITYRLKAIYNNKTINLNYESLDNYQEILDTIKKYSDVIDNDNNNKLCENDYKLSKGNLKKVDYNKIKEELIKLNDYKNYYPFIVNINSAINYTSIERRIDNIKHHMEDLYSYYNGIVCISGKKDDVVKTKYISLYSSNFDINEIKKEIDINIKELELEFNATSIKTGKYKVILRNNVLQQIILNMSDMFDAKSNYLKLSVLSDKLNQKVFSNKITILEEPINPKYIVNRHFDVEGTLTNNKELVKDGVFKLEYNNLEYALKTKKAPTGNASGLYNLSLKPGNKTYDELIKLLDNGIVITSVNGIHSGINHATGDISLQAEGILIKNGKIERTLNMIILSTNIFELLNNVIEVGNDIKEFSYSISSPSILVDNITISGSKN